METATIEALAKSVAEIKDLAQKGQENMKEVVTQMIADALKSHPGRTTSAPLSASEIGDAGYRAASAVGETKEDRILRKMPVELQMAADEILLASVMLKRNPRELKMYRNFREDAGEHIKALDTAASGGGSEWIPTNFSPELERLVRLELKVAALFPEVAMPSPSYTLPIQVGGVQSYKHAENTADTSQTKIPVGDGSSITSNNTLAAVGHGARVLFSEEVDEDSIVPMLPFLREEVAYGLAEGREDGMLNGDTAGTHEDSDVSDASDRRKMWLGMRAEANDRSWTTDLGGAWSTANLRAMRSAMGKYGVDPSKLAWITGPVGFFKFLGLPEVLTVDKYGAAATILSGELAKFDGIPIIVSPKVREDLGAAGVYAASSAKTVVHLAHRRSFIWGKRREFSVRLLSEIYAESGQLALIAKERRAFKALYGTSEKTHRLGYNVS